MTPFYRRLIRLKNRPLRSCIFRAPPFKKTDSSANTLFLEKKNKVFLEKKNRFDFHNFFMCGKLFEIFVNNIFRKKFPPPPKTFFFKKNKKMFFLQKNEVVYWGKIFYCAKQNNFCLKQSVF